MASSQAAFAELKFRDPVTTARDTLVYWNSLPDERRAQMRAGLTAEREAAALVAWHALQDGEKKPG